MLFFWLVIKVCVGADGATLKRYADAHEIIDDFFPVRLAMVEHFSSLRALKTKDKNCRN